MLDGDAAGLGAREVQGHLHRAPGEGGFLVVWEDSEDQTPTAQGLFGAVLEITAGEPSDTGDPVDTGDTGGKEAGCAGCRALN